MVGLHQLLNDEITLVKANGEKIENIKANVQKGKIIVLDETIPFEKGDKIERQLTNGTSESYEILDTGFQKSPAPHQIPNHFQIEVKKITFLTKEEVSSSVVNHFHGNVEHSQIQQNTTNSTQNLTINYLNELEEELKKENPDKSKIKKYLTKIGEVGLKLGPSLITLLSKFF